MNRKQIYMAGGMVALLVVGIVAIALVLAGAREPAEASGPRERPFLMRTDEVVVGEGPSGECPFLQVAVQGSGNASHLGSVTVTRTHCFGPSANPPIGDGRWEAVAANGDRVWGSYFGSMEPTEFDDQGNPVRGRITSPYTLEGGTGRFEGATGEGITTADYNLVTDEGEFLTEGFIWYGK